MKTMLPTFRPMDTSDIPEVLELERATYPEPWSSGVFTDELSQENRVSSLPKPAMRSLATPA